MKTNLKRNLRIGAILLALAILGSALTGCSGAEPNSGSANDMMNGVNLPQAEGYAKPNGTDEDPSQFLENPFIEVAKQSVSTFSADVDTASYALFRKTVNYWTGQKANAQTVLSALKKSASSFRTEEFLNYFRYDATSPGADKLFGVTSAIVPCPWNQQNQLLRLTLQASAATPTGGNNLVFLIDVSGSMSASDKLPLLKQAFAYLTEQLTAADRVSIVTYSGTEKVVLQGCSGADHEAILNAVNSLEASGATNGQSGLAKAYQLAADYRIEGGNNRIIMASDGDLNVGISSPTELKSFVAGKRDEGIFLSVLGFGSGNYRDANMEALADNGNGVYYYIDGVSEAKRVFGDDLISTLYTVAKDVKLQLTFDPTYISAYRQIGYENRQLEESDFTDDTKDAGEVGAGHQITVFYELIPTENATKPNTEPEATWVTLAVRYKEPDGAVSKENSYRIGAADRKTADSDIRFMICVIECVMLLHDSRYLGEDMTYATVLAQLNGLDLDHYTDRAEFRELIRALVS